MNIENIKELVATTVYLVLNNRLTAQYGSRVLSRVVAELRVKHGYSSLQIMWLYNEALLTWSPLLTRRTSTARVRQLFYEEYELTVKPNKPN